MTGHPDRQVLALWAGGDLDPSTTAYVGLHLDGCAECRGVVNEFENARTMLRGVLAEPSEVDLQLVRRGVARGLDLRRRRVRWRWSLGGAVAALAVFSVSVTHRESPKAAGEEPAVELPILRQPMHLALNIAEVKGSARPRVRRLNNGGEAGLRAINLVPRADGSTQLRLVTADPNIVILLSPVERTVKQ